MTQGERVNEVRKKSQLTMDQFGERLGVTKTAISYVVNGKRNLTEQMLKSICREFSVDEEWLRTGDGDMPQKLSEEEEVSALVSDLLEDGRDNPFFGIILEIVQTYNELSPASQKVLQEASKKLVENLSKKKEGERPLFSPRCLRSKCFRMITHNCFKNISSDSSSLASISLIYCFVSSTFLICITPPFLFIRTFVCFLNIHHLYLKCNIFYKHLFVKHYLLYLLYDK